MAYSFFAKIYYFSGVSKNLGQNATNHRILAEIYMINKAPVSDRLFQTPQLWPQARNT